MSKRPLLVSVIGLALGILTLGAGDDATQEKTDPGPRRVEIGKITWYLDYDEAAAAAKKAGKPLWLHFGENPG